MRWFRLGLGKRQIEHDPGRQAALVQDVRQRFGPHVQMRLSAQADEVVRVLAGDDGIAAAAQILRETADAAEHDLLGQAAALYQQYGHRLQVDRRNYRPMWKAAGPYLRWQLFALPVGFHPYVHVAAAATAAGADARRTVQVLNPGPLLGHLFEILDLTIAGWEFGNVRVDTDAATLATRLIGAGRTINAALDDPPPLPPPVRELMRSNKTYDVYDATANQLVGRFNPGRTMREELLA